MRSSRRSRSASKCGSRENHDQHRGNHRQTKHGDAVDRTFRAGSRAGGSPVTRPPIYNATMVRMTAQTPIPTLIPLTGAAAWGLAELAKIASPSNPNTDQIAANVNIPAQIRPGSFAAQPLILHFYIQHLPFFLLPGLPNE